VSIPIRPNGTKNITFYLEASLLKGSFLKPLKIRHLWELKLLILMQRCLMYTIPSQNLTCELYCSLFRLKRNAEYSQVSIDSIDICALTLTQELACI
jgi:hypothetical protein